MEEAEELVGLGSAHYLDTVLFGTIDLACRRIGVGTGGYQQIYIHTPVLFVATTETSDCGLVESPRAFGC